LVGEIEASKSLLGPPVVTMGSLASADSGLFILDWSHAEGIVESAVCSFHGGDKKGNTREGYLKNKEGSLVV